jgi:glycosyltransferase involved in cell wall biosynthesis
MPTLHLPGDAVVAPPPEAARRHSGRKTRVLHIVNGEHYAGAERVQDLLAAALPEFGFEVVFAAVKPDQFPLRRKNGEAPLYETPMHGKFDLRAARQIAAIAARENCELIHTHTVRSAMVGRAAAWIASLPMVHHLHSPTSDDSTHSIRNWFNTIVERRSTARVAGAIAVSNSLATYGVKHGIPAEKIQVVHNGVPVTGALAARPTPVGTWTLGCVALFRPRKGLEVLLEALSLLSREGIDVRLRAVGRFETSTYERVVMAQVERLGIGDRIEWRGFRGDVAAEFASMDLFVLPSLFGEGLPMVLLEAMSYGVPAVATRVEGVPEALRDGIDGLIAEANDPRSLADRIVNIIDGSVDWQALRTSAHRRQADAFSARSMAEGVAKVYRNVLASCGVAAK